MPQVKSNKEYYRNVKDRRKCPGELILKVFNVPCKLGSHDAIYLFF